MKKILYPLLALLLGAAGYFLRLRQLAEARDPNTDLLLSSSPETVHLIGLSLAAAAVLLVCALTVPREAEDWQAAFRSASPLPKALSCIAALGFGGAGCLTGWRFFRDLRYGQVSPFQAVFALLLLCACVCALLLAFRPVDGTGTGSLLPVLPGFTTCIWLVLTYHGNASDPSVLAYAWQLMAVIFACLSWYYAAGYAFRRRRPRRAAFFQLMTVTFCLTALADRTALTQRILLAATGLWFLSQSAVLFTGPRYLGRREEKADSPAE